LAGERFNPTPTTAIADERAQIRAAFEQIHTLGLAAFPDLAANSEDPRYSFTRIYAAVHNHTVGEACRMVMEDQIEYWGVFYKSREGTGGRSASMPRYLRSM
jgi:hypothetical protein